MTLDPDSQVGPYEIMDRLGKGGMSTVFKAHQPSLDRYVAIKVLPTFFAEDEVSRERFRQEARALARLRHANIVTVFDHGEDSHGAYIVTEFVDGGTLADRLGHPMTADEVVKLLRPIAAALDYAHAQGIIHRDVKPSNVLLHKDGTPVLCDFGVALVADSTRLTRSGMMPGTPLYMAPEQLAGEEIGPPADIYALACIAYEMLIGSPPFGGNNPLAVLWAHANSTVSLRRDGDTRLNQGEEAVLLRGLAKQPEDRFETASAMIEALAGGGAAFALEENLQSTVAPSAGRSKSRLRLGMIVALGVALVAIASVLVMSLNSRRQASVTTLFGTGSCETRDGPVASAAICKPIGLGFDPSGKLIVLDLDHQMIRVVSLDSHVSTLAGANERGFRDGNGITARFNEPTDLAFDKSGAMLVAHSANNRIRRVTPSGEVSTAAGSGEKGRLDGPASEAQFDGPGALAFDKQGNLLIIHYANHTIRQLANGVVTTIAGSGESGSRDGPADTAQFTRPAGIAIDSTGAIFIADQGNHKIRMLKGGEVSTFAGGGRPGFRDGVGDNAEFNGPTDLAFDKTGNLYVADYGNNAIRRITPSGDVTTVVGGGPCGFRDGPAKNAAFCGLTALEFGPDDLLYVADPENHRVRKIELGRD